MIHLAALHDPITRKLIFTSGNRQPEMCSDSPACTHEQFCFLLQSNEGKDQEKSSAPQTAARVKLPHSE